MWRNEAKVVAGDTVTHSIIGTPVHCGTSFAPGQRGASKVTFRDDTVLTLAEKP